MISTLEYTRLLKSITKREGLFIAINVACIDWGIPYIEENKKKVAIVLEYIFEELEKLDANPTSQDH